MNCLECKKELINCVCGGFNCIDPKCGAHYDEIGNLNSIIDDRGRVVYKKKLRKKEVAEK